MNERVEMTQEALIAECRRRFGDDPLTWAFECPQCGDVATARDYPPGMSQLGQACVGRWTKGRGCNWTAFGLIGGPWAITMPDGKVVGSFPLAPAP